MADPLHPLGLVGVTQARSPQSVLASIVERYFQTALFLLICAAFIALLGTNRLDSLSVIFVGVALVVRAYLLIKRREFKIPERWTTYLTLIYVLVFVVDLFMISGSYVTASVHLVLFSLVVKMFSIQRERDYVYLAVLAFLAVLAASVLTVDTMFLGAFFAFIMLAVSAFISMEVRRSMKQAKHSGLPPASALAPRQLSTSLTVVGAMMVIGIIVGSAAFFFVLPRFSAGYLGAFSQQNTLVTGFGENVRLGEIGEIKQTDTVVMHVQMQNENVPDLKWRGIALTVFDGKSWKNQANEREVMQSFVGRYSLRQAEVQRHNLPQDPRDFRLVRYRVVMEPIGTEVVFLPATPVELGGRFRQISIDETGSILNSDTSHMTESYEGLSQISRVPLDKLEAQSGNYPADVGILYLQQPPVDPRVHELAVKVVGDARSDYAKVAAIERYLRENFAYSLDLGNVAPKDPIAYFLFERKSGHCEYFASSMAVMLRTIGIPSRIVNGFRMGEYNDLTGSYIIRARDAHSWVEAYIPGAGWTTFDPTPPDPQPATNSISRIRLYLDAAQEFWREWVINYDFGHQRQLTVATVTTAQRSAYDFRQWWRKKYNALIRKAEKINDAAEKNPRDTTIIVLLGLGLVTLLANLQLIIRRFRYRAIASKPAKAPQMAATIWYVRMVKAVARRGYPKKETQTAAEFVKTIPEPPLRESVSKFTERYEEARFGRSPEAAEQLPRIYEEIAGKK